MPVYVYRAADRRGQTVDGVMEAADARAVVERLHREAYFPIKVTAHAGTAAWSGLAAVALARRPSASRGPLRLPPYQNIANPPLMWKVSPTTKAACRSSGAIPGRAA